MPTSTEVPFTVSVVFVGVTDRETVDYLYDLWQNAEVEGESETIGRGVDLYATFRDTKTGETERFVIFPDGVASWNEEFPHQYYSLKDGREIYRTFMQYRTARMFRLEWLFTRTTKEKTIHCATDFAHC